MDQLQRGDVVQRGRAFGVVWQVTGRQVVLLPLSKPGKRRACDVELGLAELIAAGVEMGEAVVRVGHPIACAEPSELRRVGVISGTVCCRLTLAAIRAASSRQTEAVWDAERRHRAHARGNKPVQLVGG